MSDVLTDDFEGTLAKWSTVGGTATISSGNGAGGSKSVRFTGAGDHIATYFPEQRTFRFSIDFRAVDPPNDPGGNLIGVAFKWGAGQLDFQIAFYIRGDFKIGLLRNVTEIATSTLAITEDTYYHIDFDVHVDDTVGTAVVTVNGTEFINFTGDTKGNPGPPVVDYVILGKLQPFGAPTTHDMDNVSLTNDTDEFVIDNSGQSLGSISGEIAFSVLPLGLRATPSAAQYLRSQFVIPHLNYNGTCRFFLEIVARNSGTAARDMRIFGDGGSTLVATFTINPSAGENVLYPREEFTPTDSDVYILENTDTNDGEVQITEVRVIIEQISGTRRTAFFPFGVGASDDSTQLDASIGGGDLDRTANHNVFDHHAPAVYEGSRFLYIAHEWDHVSHFTLWVLVAGGFSGVYARLWDFTASAQVNMDVAFLLPENFLTPVPISANVNKTALISGHEYGIVFWSSHENRNAYLYNGWLEIHQNVINRGNTYFRFMKASGGGLVTTQRFRLNHNVFTNFSGFVESTAGSEGTVELNSHGTNDFGSMGAVTVATLFPGIPRAVYRTGIITPGASGNRYIGNGSCPAVLGAFFVARVVATVSAFGAIECGIDRFDLSINVGF